MADHLPLIRAEPGTLVEILRDWLTARCGDLTSRGVESRRFVEKWHDPRDVARGLLADYEAAIQKAERAT